YQFPVPTEEELGPDVVDAMRAAQSAESLPCEFPSAVPFGLSWSFVRCWSRLYGTVTLEVFRHMAPEVIDSGALFRSMLADLSGDLGLGDDWPRLQAISSAELAGPV
ncbi:MAG: hypothetical protein ACRDP4_10115, partial [Nocardioidaceae bacterium]